MPVWMKSSKVRWVVSRGFVVLLSMFCSGSVYASYFAPADFKPYQVDGIYPFWSENWTAFEPKLRFDSSGVPFAIYRTGTAYNPVTVAIFGLLAYNRFYGAHKPADRDAFLLMAQWLVDRQDANCGCWFYDFEYSNSDLSETLPKHWVSAMAQGLGISLLTRAHFVTQDPRFLQAAERALLPFHKSVEQGGVTRPFRLAQGFNGLQELVYFEEYPSRKAPSYVLNGFMFALLGLYDLSQVPNADAASLLEGGIATLHAALPFYDLGDGTAYDLNHLTRAPHEINRSESYHLVHITLLNALGSATNDALLIWYRDHWNSYGSFLDPERIWAKRVGYWALRRHPLLTGTGTLCFVGLTFLTVWSHGKFKRVRTVA